MAKGTILVIRGTVDWAKITGKARPHTGAPKYDKGPYWSVDITPDAKSRKLLKDNGLTAKLREPKENDARKDSFLSLKVLESRADGEKNDPPRITDARGQVWDGRLIGNGSIVDIKVKAVDYGSASEAGLYFQAARVLDLVPYEGGDFAPLSEDDKYFAGEDEATGTDDSEVDTKGAGKAPASGDLDDDVPF